MISFIFFSLFYPLNLYIFEYFFIKRSKDNVLKVKVASIACSCLVLLSVVGCHFDFTWAFGILQWFLIGLAPFILPWWFTEVEEKITEFIFWRNFVIAPFCEELYYRLLLPQINANIWLLSISFSLAHAHPLIFAENRSKAKNIIAQCFISFCFGLVCNAIRMSIDTSLNNFWVLLTLSTIHGIANYCGVPLLVLENGKFLFYTQIIILITSIYLIIFTK